MKKIICVGTRSDLRHNRFTGQSVMFDGVVKYLKESSEVVDVVDISSKIRKKGVVFRSLDYLFVLSYILFLLLTQRYKLAYIITSQSRNGNIRDIVMITMCRWFKVPVVIHQYGANYHQLLDSISEKGLGRLKTMLNYVSSIIVEGDYMKEQFSFLEGYKHKVIVIPNGLPIEGKHIAEPKKYDGKAPFILFYLSNLIWSKGYFDVLKALDILVNEKGKNVSCVFAGQFMESADDKKNGISNRTDFELFIKEHGLQDKVKYYSGLYGKEKEDYFSKVNTFLLPTYYINEGQPVSIIEAMAYGCVPIVTKFRHIPMMVNDNNGCFVMPKSPEDIANAVIYLIENPEIYARKSQQCIDDYMENFRFNKYAKKVMECINTNKL